MSLTTSAPPPRPPLDPKDLKTLSELFHLQLAFKTQLSVSRATLKQSKNDKKLASYQSALLQA